jgi:hypothetical protein
MLVIREEKNAFRIGEIKNLHKESLNSYSQFKNQDGTFNEEIASRLTDFRNIIVEAFHKTEQMNEKRISEIKKFMLQETVAAIHKTEQINDERIKKMIQSFVDKTPLVDKFERVDVMVHNLAIVQHDISKELF